MIFLLFLPLPAQSWHQRPYRRDRLPRAFVLLSSTGQSQNFTGHLSVEYASSASLLQANWRMFSWLWDIVDFDSKYKILRGETSAHGVPIHEKEKKGQNNNLHNYSKISSPCNIRLTHVGVERVCFLADCLSSMQKWPVVGSSFGWLI